MAGNYIISALQNFEPMNLTQYERDALTKLMKSIERKKWSNAALVQLIEVSGDFLNLKTIPDYAKEHSLSYNGVKKTRQVVEIFNQKFIIND